MQEPYLHNPHHFRLCSGRVLRHRWIKAGGGFGCPVNKRYFVFKGLHTHRFRGAHFIMGIPGHKRTKRAEFFVKKALR